MRQVSSEIYERILRYIGTHPAAGDTAEGIAEWWLSGSYPVAKVKEVIDRFIAEGFIIEIKGQNSQSIYKAIPTGDENFKHP